ncbi:MAG: DUF885 domain-containing protein [Gemmatimonadota bacterium]|nr:MAG: DUF885 domain-containing protein [Gemmatimonadota bacterium]
MGGSAFDRLVASCLDLKWHLDPVEATNAGIQDHDHRLGAFSADELKQSLAALKSLSSAVEGATMDSIQDEVDQTALLNDLRVTISRFERERQQERDPLFWISHVLEGLYSLLVLRDRPKEHRSRAAAERLKAIPSFLDTAWETLVNPPAVLLNTAADVAMSGAALVDEVVIELPAGGEPELDAVGQGAQESLVAFSDRARAEAGDKQKNEIGIGEEAFNFRLHYEHALNANAAELWRYGMKLVEETEDELVDVAAAIDGETSWPDLVDRLRSDHPDVDELVGAYASEMERSRHFVSEHDLVPIPDGTLEVVPTPQYLRPLIPFAAYQPPGAFSSDKTGWFYVTQPDRVASSAETERRLRDHCVYEIACTALHEGYPGHHVQFLSAQAQPRLVRKVIHTPLTVEGWALYCEEMMGEHGFYRGQEERLFRLLALLWRAVRILIDVGIHTRGMTFHHAVQLLIDKIHFDKESAEAEVRRYCAQPAYQLCYAIGCRELISLRSDYRTAAGGSYSEAQFHSEVMSYGGLPVSLMRWGMNLNE